MSKTTPNTRLRRRRARADGPGALGLLEEAVALIRGAPAELLGLYYAGTAPFVLGFLFFWAEMSRGAFARERCAGQALLLAVLFLVMKTAQALFSARIRRLAQRSPEPAWSWRRVGRAGLAQAILQPAGLILLPLAGLAVLPFGHAYAYFVNLGVLAEDAGLDLAGLRRRAWDQARRQPLQTNLLVWLTCPWITAGLFLAAYALVHGVMLVLPPEAAPHGATLALGVVVLFFFWPLNPLCMALAVNLAVALLAVPFLLLKLFGLETVFTLSQAHAALNTTFLAVVFGLVYLAVDPLAKAAFALKCFHGESLRTGADLRARLAGFRETRRAAGAGGRLLALALLVLLPVGSGLAAGNGLASGRWATAVSGFRFQVSEKRTWWKAKIDVLKPGGSLAFLATAGPAPAESLRAVSSPPRAWSAEDLDAAVRRVLERREYRWRLRRVNPEPRAGWRGWSLAESRLVRDLRAWLRGAAEWAAARGRTIRAWWSRWSRRLFGKGLAPGEVNVNWDLWLYATVFVLAAALLASLALLLRRHRRSRPALSAAEAVAAPAVDLTQERVSADRLPPDEWLIMARDLMSRGDWRLAMRAFFLSGLAFLAQRELVRLAPAKTNRDYARELGRFQAASPDLVSAFLENTGTFDRVWYGDHPLAADALDRFAGNLERIRAHAPQP